MYTHTHTHTHIYIYEVCMLLLLTHTLLADQTIHSKAENHQGRGARNREVRAALAGTRCTLHASLTASLTLPCKLIPSAKQHRTPF